MKTSVYLLVLFTLFSYILSCTKKEKNTALKSDYIPLKYDTVPVDSFAPGAKGENISDRVHSPDSLNTIE